MTRPAEAISTILLEQAAAMTERTDAALTVALQALLEAAPQHRALVMRLEEAASARANDLADAAFVLGVNWATNPSGVLLENN